MECQMLSTEYIILDMYTYKKKESKNPEPEVEKSSIVPGNIQVLDVPPYKKARMITFMGSTQTQVFTIRFSNDDKFLAAGTIDGDVNLYNAEKSKMINIGKSWKKESLPTTCIRWKPKGLGADPRTFISTCADGSLTWFNRAGYSVHRETLVQSLLCCEYSSGGEFIVVGRDDFALTLFDEATQKRIHTYEGTKELDDNGGHSNRVFCIRSIPEMPQVFVSGGWDSKLRIWDCREKQSVRSIYGPHISGDSIDYKNGCLLTGSYRNNDILQLWDFKSGYLAKTIKVDVKEHAAAYCYTAQFAKGKRSSIGIGLSGCNQFHLYDSKKDYALCGKIQMQAPCYTIDFGNESRYMAVSGAEGVIYLLIVD